LEEEKCFDFKNVSESIMLDLKDVKVNTKKEYENFGECFNDNKQV